MNEDPTALLTPQGQELLSLLAAEPGGGSLALATRLRRSYPAGLVALATAQHELRTSALAKFSRADRMLFTRAGYEQSSSEPVSRYRVARLSGLARIADLCCGIGGDLIALAAAGDSGAAATSEASAAGRASAVGREGTVGREIVGSAGREIVAVDRDETHARLALHNAGVYYAGAAVRAVVADVRDIRFNGIDAVFIDPARRSGQGTASASAAGRFRAGASEPPLDWCFELAGRVPAVCVKAAPGLPAEVIPDGWEAEFIADGRDLKEAVLWSPALAASALATAPPLMPSAEAGTGRAGGRGPRRATVLTDAGLQPRAHSLTAHPGDPVPLAEPGEYLLDPNPAVTRAGLVEDLARVLGADVAKIDPQIAFLTLDRQVETPFARTLKVLDSAPWNEKQFAKRLRDLDIGAVDIRRRGLAGDVDQIRKRLKLVGHTRATVVITRVGDRPWGLICVDPA